MLKIIDTTLFYILLAQNILNLFLGLISGIALHVEFLPQIVWRFEAKGSSVPALCILPGVKSVFLYVSNPDMHADRPPAIQHSTRCRPRGA